MSHAFHSHHMDGMLEELAQHNEVPRQVLQYRQLAKLKSNYIDSLPLLADAEGRVHTTFNQVGTATGRLSSTNPNLQNIPIKTELGREIRAAFIAAPGNVLISADYSQIELRLMAHFSEDPLLVKAFAQGDDIHTLTASEVFGVAPEGMDKQTRDRAKAVNFGIVYGISPFGLAAQLNIDQKTAREYIETYFARYTGVAAFIERTPPGSVRKSMSDKDYREFRTRPLLMLHVLDIRYQSESTGHSLHEVTAWGISFPTTALEEIEVEYVVNTKWWNENSAERQGARKYVPETYGVNAEDLKQRFAFYHDRYPDLIRPRVRA